ncbi:glycosyltransferase family 117 protein [Candidatus Azobacteroides pseudotrichonymphae]|uniref:DUF2723 domain-containing protein n=1 Tax=Azobacteroides pseudotrichonymphae genomovar. CFP2 TaxID=511995 RepID=B6YRJ5_AZOPC|nr:DUF2723 domain-containing protein [Candidatus Azobacteroides pseudotrichonymphae]BAG83817.1 conserved hypothetical protein [Candidatus Azobacteroides pseudotrichonymphae genomovar. CFP2]
MEIKKYKLVNNISGWIIFTIAAIVYLMTIEPTASFWDCSEFITSAYKLEVGHPPGAPIFMLVGNLVSHLAPNPSQVALVLNALSAILSALTILFLFWTITRFVGIFFLKDISKKISYSQLITILGAGVTGALAYTFSDTFWFSAVEGEVYAFSSFMTAIIFWLILKWKEKADEPHSSRWLILIAYLIGISIAIHLLILLCIPAITLVYYFHKKPNPTWKGIVITLAISFSIIISILYGLIQGLLKICGWFELLFVNVFQLPYNSGVLFYLLLIFSILSWAIWETMHDSKNFQKAKIAFIISITLLGIPFLGNGLGLGIFIIITLSFYLFVSKNIDVTILNTILISLGVITIGYSSYALIIIRSISNTPMNQNSPKNIFTLKSYLTREQYGETPLFYGQTFASKVKYENRGGVFEAATKDEGAIWSQISKKEPFEKDRYFESGRKKYYVYESNTLFPRMYSSLPQHIQGYKTWTNFKGIHFRVNSPQGSECRIKPTFGENLKFFLRYQVNFMYWRYFLWNFSGRQNNIQGYGEITNGNWITGIGFLDQLRLGPQDNMPDSIAKNKGHNKFYMLPLLLGIVGIFFQIHSGKKGIEQFWITFLLFFMTGLAIVIYLNQTPFQPRERDYAYAGSFYAFCIWIGIGTVGIIRVLKYFKIPNTATAISGTILCLLIPIQMASQTWDDHDRSGRFIVRDFAMNYLSTCEPNAIIFTNGDNDTFPLWYVQEVEGFRNDVRVCNLSYLQTDWYIDQMKRQAYESKPLPIEWKKHEYTQGKHDIAYIFNERKEPMQVEEILNRIKSENIKDKYLLSYNFEIDNIPSYKITIPVDSAAVIASGLVKPENAIWIPHYLLIDLGNKLNTNGEPTTDEKRYLTKDEMMILEILKNNKDWSRPIYYARTVGLDKYLRLFPYFRCDGIAYRIVPFEATRYQPIDIDIMYENVINKYHWGNLEQSDIYLDENTIQMIRTFRIIFGQLAMELIEKKKFERAKDVLDKCLKVIPSYNVPYDYSSTVPLANAYHQIGDKKKANELYIKLAEISLKDLKWYNRLNDHQYTSVTEDIKKNVIFLQNIIHYLLKNNPEIGEKYFSEFLKIIERFQKIMKNK